MRHCQNSAVQTFFITRVRGRLVYSSQHLFVAIARQEQRPYTAPAFLAHWSQDTDLWRDQATHTQLIMVLPLTKASCACGLKKAAA